MKEKKIFFILFFLFLTNKSNAQANFPIQGRITDYNTGQPLADAVIKVNEEMTTSDSDGYYKIHNNPTGILKVSLLGFEDKIENTKSGENIYNISLKRKYYTLSDVQINANKLNVDSIISKAANNVPLNYLPPKNTLKAILKATLYATNDTVLDFSKIIYLEGLRNYSFHYDIFSSTSDTPTIYKNTLTKELRSNYIYEDDKIIQGSFQKLLKRYIGLKEKGKTVVSTYTDNNIKYYDLVFIDSNANIKYSPLLIAFGYSRKMSNMAQKRYIELTEMHVNTITYAVSFYTDLYIEITDTKRVSFLKLKNRIDIENWIDNAIEKDRKYTVDKFSFEKLNNNYWLLRSVYHFDNLIHPLSRDLNPTKNYTYILQYNITSPVAKPPIDVRGFDIGRYLDHMIQ
ncbi:MAG TPA: carboxypeptidase-like regulatory domain-containing protein [Flavipsychrobacter sp.]|nr:carboxypeptidase-like regulatory domain-containing protein [Flavipsychrobacter sp.]